MLQQSEPDDYVLATGTSHSVREFVELAFACIGRGIVWSGAGVDERGVDRKSGQTVVRVDPRYFRPTELDALCGDAEKARRVLGWTHTVAFEELVREMVESDLARISHQGRRIRRDDVINVLESSG